MNYRLYQGDCLDILPTLGAGSVDAVVTDPPYGTTACAWDSVIPFAPMWTGIKHVLKPRGAAVLFGSQPFTSALVMSNVEWFKYDLVWEKSIATGFLNANRMPLRGHESILVFSENAVGTFNPQKLSLDFPSFKKNNTRTRGTDNYGDFGLNVSTGSLDGSRYPRSIFYIRSEPEFFNSTSSGLTVHPTQKPVALMEYLIRTYTNEGDTVLDFTMGSGTTGVAALLTGRKFIGVELDAEYFAIAQERIEKAAQVAAGEFVDKRGKGGDLVGLPMFEMAVERGLTL